MEDATMPQVPKPQLEPYLPAPGFWRPSGRAAARAVKDTAETMLQTQTYRPRRQRRVHPESLESGQRVREEAFAAGRQAHAAGRGRTSSSAHQTARRGRTTLEDFYIAAFELGWDTEARASAARRSTDEVAHV